MGAKGKKSLIKKLINFQLAIARRKNEPSDFLPLEGGPGQKIPEPEDSVKDTATVLYIGRIPHGFYEDQMEGFFKQFGKIERLRIARNKKEKTIEEHQLMVQGILKREKKQRKQIEAAGIDYECPDFVGQIQPASKKIKFDDAEED